MPRSFLKPSSPYVFGLILVTIVGVKLWSHSPAELEWPIPIKTTSRFTSKVDPYLDDTLCPYNDGDNTLKCNFNCYKSDLTRCPNAGLITPVCSTGSRMQQGRPQINATTLSLSNPPYETYFYSDCNLAAQLVVTSPLPDSDLTIIGPRIIFAWPSGNSGACMFFEPQNGKNGTLGIKVVNTTVGVPLAPVYISRDSYPAIGSKGVIHFNSTAVLSLSILGSIRAIRDFTEGPGLLRPILQKGINLKRVGAGMSISRLWLDNVTTMTVVFVPASSQRVTVEDGKATLEAGEYIVSAHINYPQMEQLSVRDTLRDHKLIEKYPKQSKELSFLTYSEKMLAGAWRFLTYFGRDSMITTLLLQPILSESAIEAVIGSVLERINSSDGSACHEETIGDFATFLNLQDGKASTEYRCDYSMVDTDYFVPILIHAHFLVYGAGAKRLEALLSTPAGGVDPSNKGLTWGDLFTILARKIMTETAPFASPGGQKRENLIHLREGMDTGVWRDSVNGIGGGRIPFDVNVALAPAALHSIAVLAKEYDNIVFGNYSQDWAERAERYATVWEDKAMDFFKAVLPAETVRERLETFVKSSSYYDGPSHAELVDADLTYYTLALEGNNGLDLVPVMNSDASVRLFFFNSTHQKRLTEFINNTALSIIRPFPAGLTTPFGMVVANPAISGNDVVVQNFSNSAYHGTVIWSWQLAAMAKGFEKQLGRCDAPDKPEFCSDAIVYKNVKNAYNCLWDVIEKNEALLSDEVWTWVYEDGEFKYSSLGSLAPPPGVDGVAESDMIQLWSLTFLAVRRNEAMR